MEGVDEACITQWREKREYEISAQNTKEGDHFGDEDMDATSGDTV
jgi:hypothetical protein